MAIHLLNTELILLLIAMSVLCCKPMGYLYSKVAKRPENALLSCLARHASSPAFWVIISFGAEATLTWVWPYLVRAIVGAWLFLAVGEGIYQYLRCLGKEADKHPFIASLKPSLRYSIKFILLAFGLPTLIPDFAYTAQSSIIFDKLSSVLSIWSIAWLLMQLTSALESFTLQRYNTNIIDDFRSRRISTQTRVFRKVATVAIAILALAISLTVFESVRELGTSLLASAGIATVVAGLAAQRTLGNLFAGLQIAITQPIKINDALIIQNEFGTVEEITLSYVVLRLWDLRRMIIPINYFLENPFQNWTRTSTSLLAPAFLYFDYSLPVAPLRQELTRILENSKKWDGIVCALQVTDATEGAIQLRALGSASNASNAFDLKCEMREKLVEFVSKNYPLSLPRVRQEYSTVPREIKIPTKELL